jgi:hypothetical protein
MPLQGAFFDVARHQRVDARGLLASRGHVDRPRGGGVDRDVNGYVLTARQGAPSRRRVPLQRQVGIFGAQSIERFGDARGMTASGGRRASGARTGRRRRRAAREATATLSRRSGTRRLAIVRALISRRSTPLAVVPRTTTRAPPRKPSRCSITRSAGLHLGVVVDHAHRHDEEQRIRIILDLEDDRSIVLI